MGEKVFHKAESQHSLVGRGLAPAARKKENALPPSGRALVKLCDALEVTPNDILLGASVHSTQYMNDELQDKISQCTPKEKRLIEGFVSLLLAEREL